jgi:Aerotolerance regulator N-terminal
MSLTFLNPLFLFGLTAGIIPVLIHRLTKRRSITRKFSAVRLILQSQRTMARPQRLKHLLLLALRVLAVMSLAFMMARPVLTRPGLLTRGNEEAKILILDNSLSMGFQEENGERYELAKKAAREMIRHLKGQIMIIPTASVRDHHPRWMAAEEALREADQTSLSYEKGDPGAALSLAYQRLKGFEVPGEILMISDMAPGDWEGLNVSNLGTVPSEVAVTFLRVGGPNRDANFAVRGVRLAEREAVLGVPARLEVTASNLSDKSGNVLAQLYLSGVKVDQKTITFKAGEEGKGYFELFLDKPGWLDGEVRLSGDRLASDDVFYFPLKVRDKIRVLIVDGDPKRSLKASESYYLVKALNPGGSEGSPFLTRVITEGELANISLKPYDAFFLLNVARPQGPKLSSMLEMNKPVFIFLGDRVVPEEYNSLPFFPLRIREMTEAGPGKPERIAQADKSREAFKTYSATGEGGLKGASFNRYFKIEGSTKTLLSFGNGDPLLVEVGAGKGKLFLFSSSADLDWNDLPLKASYLPLIQGLLKETMELSIGALPKAIRFGEPFEKESGLTQLAGTKGGPGIYKYLSPSGEVRQGINPPPEESDLGKITADAIRKKLGTRDMKMVEYNEEALKGMYAGKKDLWPFFLAFVMVVLAFEMGMANMVPRGKPHVEHEFIRPNSPSPSPSPTGGEGDT